MAKSVVPFWAFDNFSRSSPKGWGSSTSGRQWSDNLSERYRTDGSAAVAIIDSLGGGKGSGSRSLKYHPDNLS